ncbi:MAG: hypothetical protein ACRD1O_03915, partial [Terriglobia bacterium]
MTTTKGLSYIGWVFKKYFGIMITRVRGYFLLAFSQKGVDHMMKKRVMVLLLLLGIVSVAPVFAGSAAIGTVAG